MGNFQEGPSRRREWAWLNPPNRMLAEGRPGHHWGGGGWVPSAGRGCSDSAKLTQPDSTKALMMALRMQKQPPPPRRPASPPVPGHPATPRAPGHPRATRFSDADGRVLWAQGSFTSLSPDCRLLRPRATALCRGTVPVVCGDRNESRKALPAPPPPLFATTQAPEPSPAPLPAS